MKTIDDLFRERNFRLDEKIAIRRIWTAMKALHWDDDVIIETILALTD